MATYNRAHFIVETLHSIQQQTFVDWECLIIDDGGTDNTSQVIASILEKDKRFQFLKRPENYLKGLPGCRNYGLDLAQGDYIIFFDDDDIIHPENLKVNLEVVQGNSVDFCHYQKQSFENRKPEIHLSEAKIIQSISISDIEDVITQKIGLASCTVFWHKRCFADNRFNEELMYAEEWECYSRIISDGFCGLIIDSFLYFNRKHPNSNTGEFYNNNPIRKASKKDAVLLVIDNLKVKGLFSEKLLRYFVQMALQFKEHLLFKQIKEKARLSFVERVKWNIFYSLLPIRLFLYRIKKQL
ncbi:glycosyltransferase [Flavobacterium sp. H122]|uniref:glycosyltransferase family 2 protein n=1 Tax=Flavobacterium sp. H122 TaxID=2529860 RepID=UPI0020BF644A